MSDLTSVQNTSFELPPDWRGEMMTKIRQLIRQADPEIIEEVKYKTKSNPNGVLVWYHSGMLCTGEVYKQHLRLAFSQGVLLKEQDPNGLINSHRAILLHEGDPLDEKAFTKLFQAAVALNKEKKSKAGK